MPRFKWECNNNQFSCRLKCHRCAALKPDGARCRRSTCRTTNYCWQHLRRDMHVDTTRMSTIWNAGRGLFAYDPRNPKRDIFKKNKRIGWYVGEQLTRLELDSRYPGDVTAPYGIQGNNDIILDGACGRGYLNQANGKPHRGANAKFDGPVVNIDIGGRLIPAISVVATKNIKHATEIFIDYGPQYRFDEACTHYTK